MQSLRKRTHDIANHVQTQEGILVLLEERTKVLFKRVGKLDDSLKESQKDVENLKHQAAVLKWVLGVITAVVVGVLIKVVG